MSQVKRQKTAEVLDDILDNNIDTDVVLNLEADVYREGFLEGQAHSTKQQFNEGKEYGYQTGFQRFLIVGYIKGLLEHWRGNSNEYPNTIKNHLNSLESILLQLQLTNGDAEVAHYEKIIQKARNKLRVVTMITKESWKISSLDQLVKEVGGSLQVSENVDDMW